MRENKTFGERSKTRASDEARRKCLFLCEGEETEPLYFAKLRDMKGYVGISSLIDLIQIERPRGENWSNPKKMVETLCLDLSGNTTYNSLINAMVDSLYYDSFLQRHNDKIREFEPLLVSFMHDTLNVKETDLVHNLYSTIETTLDFFRRNRPRICNIILSHIEETLQNYNITFDKEIDFLCVVVDRDPYSFTERQFDDVLKICKENGFRLLISNPNFEFWLLMHFDTVSSLDREKIKANDRIDKGSKSSVRFVQYELRKALGKYKKSWFDAESLIKNIDKAIKNEKSFCEALPDLKNEIGSNIGVFIEDLRKTGEL